MLVVSMVSSTSLTFKFSLIVSRANFIKYLCKMLLSLFSADIIMGNWFCISASDGMQKSFLSFVEFLGFQNFFVCKKQLFFKFMSYLHSFLSLTNISRFTRSIGFLKLFYRFFFLIAFTAYILYYTSRLL